MDFDVLIDGKKRTTVGDDTLEHLSVSVGSDGNDSWLLATAICREVDDKYSLIWLQEDLDPDAVVSISRSRLRRASRPMRRRRMRAGQRSTSGDRFCDFCKRSESQVKKLVQAGDSPTICDECVDLCATILGKEIPKETDVPERLAGRPPRKRRRASHR